uniref:Uncharacterized protein n=1 Tax=Triticum urartu TaxID=4572 RepID=A0A8R7V9L3_TRIUA
MPDLATRRRPSQQSSRLKDPPSRATVWNWASAVAADRWSKARKVRYLLSAAMGNAGWRAWWARRKRRVEVARRQARRTARQRMSDLGSRRARISQSTISSGRLRRRGVAPAAAASAMVAGRGEVGVS